MVTKITCPKCDHKPFRNETNLAWHLEHVHGAEMAEPESQVESPGRLTERPTQSPTGQQTGELESRLQKLERATGLREADLDDLLGDTEPLTNKLANITEQLSRQAEQVTKLRDAVSKLSEDVGLARVSRDVEREEFSKRLADLREAHNRQATVINEHRDTFNNNFTVLGARIDKVQKVVEELGEGLSAVRTKLATHEHDGLSLIPQLSRRLQQVGEEITELRAGVATAQALAVRNPTDDFERLELKNGSKHNFRVYKGKRGLANPYRVSADLFLGDKYVDLAEPED